jgi:hypothetical protein
MVEQKAAAIEAAAAKEEAKQAQAAE